MKKRNIIFLQIIALPFVIHAMDHNKSFTKVTSCCLLVPYVAAEIAQITQHNKSFDQYCPAICCLATCCLMANSMGNLKQRNQVFLSKKKQ